MLVHCMQVQDGEHVMMCLKRALKIAHAAQQQLAVALRSSDTLPAWLFVEILNHYLYYFDQGLSSISASVLQVKHLSLRVSAAAIPHEARNNLIQYAQKLCTRVVIL